jgi:hypothetical protein
VLAGRVAALRVPPGIDDPPLAAIIAELQAKLGELDQAVAALEAATAQQSSNVAAAFDRKDKVGARRTVDLAGPILDEAYARATAAFDALERRLPDAESGTSRHLATLAAVEQRLLRIAAEGGDIDLIGIRFEGAKLDAEETGTRASLQRLVQLGTSCDRIRLSISAHVRDFRDATGKVTAVARAQAVRDYMIAAGVPAQYVTTGADTSTAVGTEHVTATVVVPCNLPPDQAHEGHDHAPAAPVRVVPPGVPQPAPPVPTIEPVRRPT